ncbi:MAG TPA: hypothetical protein VGB87_22055 [Vicinamibacteria bacterium]
MPDPSSSPAPPLVSLELRWFLPDGLPPEVGRWFEEDLPETEMGSPDRRTDTYLFIPGQETLGVKLREGRIEIKWREESRPFEAHGVSGQVERWLKWSWEDAKGPAPAQIGPWAVPDGPWVDVGKTRLQRKYAWSDGRFVAAPAKAILPIGAAVEIAPLELRGRKHGTVLIEAFAPEPRAQEDLLWRAAHVLLGRYPSPRPGIDRSFGYPRWLAAEIQ